MILVTGASGYIGRALIPTLAQTAASRHIVTAGRTCVGSLQHRPLDLASPEGFRAAVAGANAVIHLAGLAHNEGDLASYEQVNVRASMALADAALSAGVRRFIFVSSLNVVPASALRPECSAGEFPVPESPYAASKWRAEQVLSSLLGHSSCQLIIVRPALVYDHELTANLAALAAQASRLPIALPASGARSMIARSDLVSLLNLLASPDGKSDTKDAPDRADFSGAARIVVATDGQCYHARRIARGLGARTRIAVPDFVWRAAARVRDELSRLPRGSTWQSLAGHYWCGQPPGLGGWAPQHTLESLFEAVPESVPETASENASENASESAHQ